MAAVVVITVVVVVVGEFAVTSRRPGVVLVVDRVMLTPLTAVTCKVM